MPLLQLEIQAQQVGLKCLVNQMRSYVSSTHVQYMFSIAVHAEDTKRFSSFSGFYDHRHHPFFFLK